MFYMFTKLFDLGVKKNFDKNWQNLPFFDENEKKLKVFN